MNTVVQGLRGHGYLWCRGFQVQLNLSLWTGELIATQELSGGRDGRFGLRWLA